MSPGCARQRAGCSRPDRASGRRDSPAWSPWSGHGHSSPSTPEAKAAWLRRRRSTACPRAGSSTRASWHEPADRPAHRAAARRRDRKSARQGRCSCIRPCRSSCRPARTRGRRPQPSPDASGICCRRYRRLHRWDWRGCVPTLRHRSHRVAKFRTRSRCVPAPCRSHRRLCWTALARAWDDQADSWRRCRLRPRAPICSAVEDYSPPDSRRSDRWCCAERRCPAAEADWCQAQSCRRRNQHARRHRDRSSRKRVWCAGLWRAMRPERQPPWLIRPALRQASARRGRL